MSDMQPLISIVIPNMNGMEHLPECFASLTAASYPADRQEWILSDNGSRDGSIEFIRKNYPQTQIVQNSGNIGFARGCNNGAAAARGEYVVVLNNDTRVDPGWLEGFLTALRHGEGAACASAHMLTWDGQADDFNGASANLFGVGRQRGVGGWPDRPGATAEGDPLLFACGGAMIIERRVFQEAGGFDPTFFIYFEDVDLGWRVWVLGHRVVYAPGSVVYHKGGGTTGETRAPSHRRYLLFESNTLSAIFKNYSEPLLGRIFPAALLLEFERALLAAGDAVNKEHYRLGGKERDPQIEEHGVAKLPPISVAHLLSMGHFVERLPHLAAERSRIQAARRRADEEILPLFGRPFEPQFAGVRYANIMRSIAAALDLYPLVARSAPNRILLLAPHSGAGNIRARQLHTALAGEFHVALAELNGAVWTMLHPPTGAAGGRRIGEMLVAADLVIGFLGVEDYLQLPGTTALALDVGDLTPKAASRSLRDLALKRAGLLSCASEEIASAWRLEAGARGGTAPGVIVQDPAADSRLVEQLRYFCRYPLLREL